MQVPTFPLCPCIKIILLYRYMKHLFKHFKIDSGSIKIMVFASFYFWEFVRAFPLHPKGAEVQLLHKLRVSHMCSY